MHTRYNTGGILSYTRNQVPGIRYVSCRLGMYVFEFGLGVYVLEFYLLQVFIIMVPEVDICL